MIGFDQMQVRKLLQIPDNEEVYAQQGETRQQAATRIPQASP